MNNIKEIDYKIFLLKWIFFLILIYIFSSPIIDMIWFYYYPFILFLSFWITYYFYNKPKKKNIIEEKLYNKNSIEEEPYKLIVSLFLIFNLLTLLISFILTPFAMMMFDSPGSEK